jgi:hypothetical protein
MSRDLRLTRVIAAEDAQRLHDERQREPDA